MKKLNLKELGVSCIASEKWFSTQPSNKHAWYNCPNGSWMLLIAKKLKVDHKKLMLAQAYCAKTVYPLLKDDKVKQALVVAINYDKGVNTEEEIDAAIETTFDSFAKETDSATTFANYTVYKALTNGNSAAIAAIAFYLNKDYCKKALAESELRTADICRKYLTSEVEKYF